MTTNYRRYGLGLLTLAAGSTMLSSAARADWLEDAYIAPMASYAIADDDRHTKDGIGGTLAFGYRLSDRIELELRGLYLSYEGDGDYRCGLLGLQRCDYEDKELGGGGFGVNLFLGPSDGGPYLHFDVMATEKAYYHGGLGWDFYLNDAGWAVRAEALMQVDSGFQYHEPQFNLGLRIPLGPRSKLAVPAPVPEPVRVVEPAPAPPPPPPPAPCTMSEGSVDLSGCKTGDTVVLRGVNFEFDKWTLTLNAKSLLDLVVEALNKRPDIKVAIHGHTDSKGSDAYNLKLSERRAKSVIDYLEGKGIAADRLSSQGYGESQPIADNETDEGRALNRRVELKVVEASDSAVAVEQAGRATETYGSTDAVPASVAPVAEPAAAEATPVAPAAAPEAPAPAAVESGSTISIENMSFVPGVLTVTAGSTVTFVNNDGSNHIIRFADGQQSPRLPLGKSWSRTFSAPGEYAYVCAIHPMMTGKIIVQ